MAYRRGRFGYRAALIAAICLTQSTAFADEESYSLGVEGFQDTYKEPDATVNSTAYYGSLIGNYTHDWNGFFAAIDGRVSIGEDHYSSSDGSVSGVPQQEFEVRPRIGLKLYAPGGSFSPYTGFGMRYYRDDFKGYTTTDAQGEVFGGYDRRIFQLYMPFGGTYAVTVGDGWVVAPNLEYDQLLWGNVSSRLGTLGQGYQYTNNQQSSGWGLRGKFMVGKEEDDGWAWEFGPFFRYWNIKESDISLSQIYTNQSGTYVGLGDEPANTRLQAGLQLRAIW